MQLNKPTKTSTTKNTTPTVRNILFIMCDQLRWDYLSCNGHPHLHTPNIDALAAHGVNFSRAFCQAPICGPSRASFYSGRYMSSHGVMANEDPFKPGERTISDYLEAIGVRTALIGKSHVHFDSARLLAERDSPAARLRAECGGFEPFERYEGLYPDRLVPKSLGYNRFLRAHGYEADNPWERYANSALDENGKVVSGWSMRNANYPSRVDAAHSDTAFLTDRAIEFVNRARAPWCLHLSFLRPHWPYLAPAPYHNMFGAEQVIAPTRDEVELRNPHPLYAALMAQEYSRNFSRDEVRAHVVPVYMGLIREVDDNLGRLFECLRARGLWDNTMIVFTADHGDYLGDHYLGEKDIFHEPSVRIPLIVRDPCACADATRGAVCDALVGAVDVLPTFLQAHDGGAPEPLEGQSLLPHLHAQPFAAREFIVSEIDVGDRGVGAVLNLHPYDCRAWMVRGKQWKYIFHAKLRHQLYDLINDSNEFNDLGDSASHQATCAQLRDELFTWMRERHVRTEVSLATLQKRGPQLDESFGIIIGRW